MKNECYVPVLFSKDNLGKLIFRLKPDIYRSCLLACSFIPLPMATKAPWWMICRLCPTDMTSWKPPRQRGWVSSMKSSPLGKSLLPNCCMVQQLVQKKKSPIAAGYFWFFRVNLPIAAQSPLVPLAFVIGQLFIWGASAFFGIFAALLITAIAYPTHRDIFTALSNYGWYVSHFSLIASSRFSFRPHVKAARRSHCNLTFSQQTLALNISLFPSYLTNPHLEKFIIFLIAAWATNGPRDYTST